MIRTAERTEFLTDVVVTAIEHAGYGWFTATDYAPSEGRAVIVADEDGERFTVTIDTVARGIGVIRDAVLRQADGDDECQPMVLHNAKTDKRLYLSTLNRIRILQAYRDCDAGELDVIDALAIIECALLGAVTYA